MLDKLRAVLVNQYIGAMVIALLVWQTGVELVTRISRIVLWYINVHQSLLVPSKSGFPWEYLVFSLVSIVLYLLMTYVLVRWLYGEKVRGAAASPEIKAGVS